MLYIFFILADTPLAEVKLGEFGKWLSRRNYTPQGMVACCSRGIFLYHTLLVLKARLKAILILISSVT